MAANALKGRDKVTLITPKKYSAFAMWIEQLLAESTGKNGKGLIPIVNEPVLNPANYGNDRQFIIFDPADDDPKNTDIFKEVKSAGHPAFVVKAFTPDTHEIAGEFFRWQFATATASAIMGIYPFDQPDIEISKIKILIFTIYTNKTCNSNMHSFIFLFIVFQLFFCQKFSPSIGKFWISRKNICFAYER